MAKLDRVFFAQDTVTVAKELLGKYLVRQIDGALLVCRITETEAYVGPIDKACHAYQYKRTPRTETLFSSPGTVYIYLIYGMYHCLNFVTESAGEPCAVLIRGAEAELGIEQMAQNRFGKDPSSLSAYQRKNFLNGPGKLCKALQLSRQENNLSLMDNTLWVCNQRSDFGLSSSDDEPGDTGLVRSGPRVNIDYAEESKYFPWRFWLDS